MTPQAELDEFEATVAAELAAIGPQPIPHVPVPALPCILRMPASQYHADEVGQGNRPGLSASIATTLIRSTPLHAWYRHAKLGGIRGESTPEQNRGTLIHALVLGVGLDQVQVIDAKDYRTKVAQQQRDRAEAFGMTPVLQRDYETAQELAESIWTQIRDAGFNLRVDDSEKVMVWLEDSESGPVLCRGMSDNLSIEGGQATILDLKNCRSAHPRACSSHVEEYGADIQAAAYISAVEHVHPDLAGRIDYVWAFIESITPTRAIVAIRRPDGLMLEIGRSKWQRAVESWGACLKSGKWPAYTEARLEPVSWGKEELP